VYAQCKHVFSSDFEARRFRKVVSDGMAVETAAEFSRQGEEIRTEARAKDSTIRKGAKAGRKLNVELSRNDPQLERRSLGLRMIDEAFGTEETTANEAA